MQDPHYVKNAFAKIAHRYVLTNHILSLGTDLLWRRKVAGLVAGLEPGNILDLATGTGDLAVAMRRRCPGIPITGVDFSAPMLDIARQQNLDHSEWLVADAMALPFPGESYDVATVAFGLRNMADWPGAVREMARVLRPSGHLVILDFSLPRQPVLRPAYRWYLHKVLPKIAGWLTGQRAAYEYLSGTIEQFPSGEDMLGLLRNNGFSGTRAIPLSGGIASIYVARKPAAIAAH